MIPQRSFPSAGSPGLSSAKPLSNGFHWRWLRGRTASKRIEAADSAFSRSPKLARLEAALFVADGAMTAKRLAQVATLEDAREASQLVEQLNAAYDAEHSAFRIEKVAAGFQLLTRPQLASWLDRVHQRQSQLKLSPPMLETLSIIAYRQPCTRADVEAVRGVQAAEIIKQLLERNLIRVTGEDDSLGRPYLYGTTRQFLEMFGLSSLDELPMSERMRKRPAAQPASSAPEANAA
ncbi:SMC-Scp complex subunit ScpB [Planctomicrobium sp. SH664]|uniref:SMC-Scp complex subunit ScpB n=1 Tax=Planctomicrobium sp. SH664 TaxID=3448125 RepID=UPI003F5C29EC